MVDPSSVFYSLSAENREAPQKRRFLCRTRRKAQKNSKSFSRRHWRKSFEHFRRSAAQKDTF
jgi:ribosomal protein L39E